MNGHLSHLITDGHAEEVSVLSTGQGSTRVGRRPSWDLKGSIPLWLTMGFSHLDQTSLAMLSLL